MLSLYEVNALVHWDERHVEARERIANHLAGEVRGFLRGVNPAWDVRRVEAPLLVPRAMISDAYTDADVYAQAKADPGDHDLVLRPETTPTTYAYMRHLLGGHARVRPPLCVWQSGKSFRREQAQPLKFMRLKEFHQMEFQCAFTADTGADYQELCLEPMRRAIGLAVGHGTRVVASERLPSYSRRTMDVEAYVPGDDRWMELCSISLRTDYPDAYVSVDKKGNRRENAILVLEIAVGLDRCARLWGLAAGEG
jgi:glycyl-tRNA synthetase